MARNHHIFEWDESKEAANIRKHSLAFDAAARILLDDEGDRHQLDRLDPRYEERRIITTTSDPADRSLVYVIVWTDRSASDEQVTRIISARHANRRETKRYVEYFQG